MLFSIILAHGIHPLEFKLLEMIVIFVLLYMTYKYGHKKGIETAGHENFEEGYKEGVKCVEDEIKELAKLSDEEILERIKKNADKNGS